MEWIRVNEQMPENSARVLYYCKDKTEKYKWIDTGCHNGEWTCEDEDMNDCDLNEGDIVTHWMPLPPVPNN